MVDAKLQFDPGCEIAGRLAFIGMELKPEGKVEAMIKVYNYTKLKEGAYENQTVTDGGVAPSIANATIASSYLDMAIFFEVEAYLGGKAELGFAGFARGNGVKISDNVPHFEAEMSLEWSWNFRAPISAPKFHMGGVKFCVGKLLAKVMKWITDKVKPILKPIGYVFGHCPSEAGIPCGFLRKEVPITKYFMGRPMLMLELLETLAEVFCDGGCNFKGVNEAIAAFEKILDMIEGFLQVPTSGNGLGSQGPTHRPESGICLCCLRSMRFDHSITMNFRTASASPVHKT